jgi:hypothetical protein
MTVGRIHTKIAVILSLQIPKLIYHVFLLENSLRIKYEKMAVTYIVSAARLDLRGDAGP